jgi:hypothetical protein
VPWCNAARSVAGFKKEGYWGLFQLTTSPYGTTIIKYEYLNYPLQAHLTKFVGITHTLR